jgi:hypothetical protein
MANTPYEAPDGLGAVGRAFWDDYCADFGDRMRPVDLYMLKFAAMLVDRMPSIFENLEAKGGSIVFGIAVDKYLNFSKRLGLSYLDRKEMDLLAAGVADALKDAEKKQTGRKKTSLDALKPENLGVPKSPSAE